MQTHFLDRQYAAGNGVMVKRKAKPAPEVTATVFVIDDSSAERKFVTRLLNSVGRDVEAFASAEEFLESYDPARPGCLLLDVRLPGMSGLELQEQLCKGGACLPVVLMSGYGDVEMTRRAWRCGAVDFLEKPYNEQTLLDLVRKSLETDAHRRVAIARQREINKRLAVLTPRERQVIDLVVEGYSNKKIAAALNVSCRTVEIHRANGMHKMEVTSLPELMRVVLALNTDETS